MLAGGVREAGTSRGIAKNFFGSPACIRIKGGSDPSSPCARGGVCGAQEPGAALARSRFLMWESVQIGHPMGYAGMARRSMHMQKGVTARAGPPLHILIPSPDVVPAGWEIGGGESLSILSSPYDGPGYLGQSRRRNGRMGMSIRTPVELKPFSWDEWRSFRHLITGPIGCRGGGDWGSPSRTGQPIPIIISGYRTSGVEERGEGVRPLPLWCDRSVHGEQGSKSPARGII